MKLSVIIIGHNSWHFLEKNLASLTFLKERTETETVYVDNASTDETIAQLTRLYPSITVYRNDKNRGVAVARNRGFRKTSGDYIWILDSDTEVSETALDAMTAFMEQHPEAGLCGCKMYGEDGDVQQSCRRFPTVKKKMKAGVGIIAGKLGFNVNVPDVGYDMEADAPFEVDYVIGACQLIRREALKKAGELDENIFYGPEDADFCLRIRQAGYRVFYLPQVSIYHAYRRVSTKSIFSKLTWKHLFGLIYYFWKHKKI